MRKSYLSQQIRLVSLATYDLFTDEEYELYLKIVSLMNELNRIEKEAQKYKKVLTTEDKLPLLTEKREAQIALSELILKHDSTPRRVRLQNVLDPRHFKDENGEVHWPPGITWRTLKSAKKIAEFISQESRILGLQHNDITFDKIIVNWKSIDVLRQIQMNGFIMPIITDSGEVIEKHYSFHTASAGQLRRDKLQMLSDEALKIVEEKMCCGLSWEKINEKSGCNVNKLMAYTALGSSATDPWPELDIDRCIVIPEFEGEVTGVMKYIKPDYTCETGTRTVVIDHTDGVGMMDPSVSRINFMIRGPWIKGLLSPFDFIGFCRENKCEPVIKDIWGAEHNLIEENIQVIFTKSQFKMYKYYDSWDQYKQAFKETGSIICRTNFEESYIQDAQMNYQFLQTINMTDEEIAQFVEKTHKKIEDIGTDRESMLRALKADEDSELPYKQALALYPELLREAYSKETLKSIKKKWLLDAKSGRIKCANKRLFVIPDFYAACQHWFLGQEHPEGLLANGEVACRIYRNKDKVDVLRSPSLYAEHAVRNVSHSSTVYEWFFTDAVVTSCHDLISRILQFDCDGDQLHVVAEETEVNAAQRFNYENHIVPLFYDANKAPDEPVTKENMFNGLKRAHDYSGIGQVSNNLTKLWNKDKPDLEAAAYLTYYNNQVIDAAKTGKINNYIDYPDIEQKINKATGGKSGKMPYFFQFSRNGRKNQDTSVTKKKHFTKANGSTMNRIAMAFNDIGNINMNLAGVPPFNWQMLLKEWTPNENNEAVSLFCLMDNTNIANVIESKNENDINLKANIAGYDILRDDIIIEMTEKYGSIENVYPSIVKYLFAGKNMDKPTHKQMFWRVFGDIAVNNIRNNLKDYTVCERCGMKVPSWVTQHICPKEMSGFFECIDCGRWNQKTSSRQCRCESCQKEYTRININRLHRKYRNAKTEQQLTQGENSN